ncbi:MAG: hypothetical protein A3F42_07445 [Gammaproteobacteria bacterium RIFCSPHIGHO2_12_FULL_37_34]|nr:MAG: hypothetical protein A3F42_07445 [Gammaproteobacteria bacterium RIFCSPHIGHO2_12_FULL_37_34]
MNLTILEVTLFALIPSICMMIGGWVGSIYTFQARSKSVTQHLVAGIVFGAVSVDLLPKILNSQSTWTVAGGFVAGIIVMLSLMEFTSRMERETVQNKLPLGLIFAVWIDVFVDGLLIGVSFVAGRESGMLITIALSACLLFLGISTAMVLKDHLVTFSHSMLWMVVIAIMMPIGAFAGAAITNSLPQIWMVEMIAFGVAALLYLGAEELLVEAHEGEDSALITLSFFLGFLAILLLKL